MSASEWSKDDESVMNRVSGGTIFDKGGKGRSRTGPTYDIILKKGLASDPDNDSAIKQLAEHMTRQNDHSQIMTMCSHLKSIVLDNIRVCLIN
jgi:hypothetical protein